jgi:hypothetical protein
MFKDMTFRAIFERRITFRSTFVHSFFSSWLHKTNPQTLPRRISTVKNQTLGKNITTNILTISQRHLPRRPHHKANLSKNVQCGSNLNSNAITSSTKIALLKNQRIVSAVSMTDVQTSADLMTDEWMTDVQTTHAARLKTERNKAIAHNGMSETSVTMVGDRIHLNQREARDRHALSR